MDVLFIFGDDSIIAADYVNDTLRFLFQNWKSTFHNVKAVEGSRNVLDTFNSTVNFLRKLNLGAVACGLQLSRHRMSMLPESLADSFDKDTADCCGTCGHHEFLMMTSGGHTSIKCKVCGSYVDAVIRYRVTHHRETIEPKFEDLVVIKEGLDLEYACSHDFRSVQCKGHPYRTVCQNCGLVLGTRR